MAKKISILVALEGADAGLKRAITSAEQSLGELSKSAKTAGDKAAAGIAEVRAGMSAFGDQVNRARTQLLTFLTINWAGDKVREIVQVADAWAMMGARLKLATAGQQEFVAAQQALFAIAQRIGVPIQETTTLYGKLQQAVRMLGGEQETALSITESISQALRLSGASATEAQASLLQFGQALAAGVLRGEEFNSVVENSPRLAQALADGLNVPIGRLRKLAEEGRLTADVVVNALMSQKDKLAAEYSQLPQTVSQAFQRLSNAFGQWISQVDSATGLSKKLADALTWLSQNLDQVMQWLQRIGQLGLAVLTYRLIPAFITAWQTAGAAAVAAARVTAAAWATANLSLTAAMATVGKLKTAFVVLSSFLVGWEIGTWLSEQFAVVRRAGVFMVEVLMKGIEALRFGWEAFAAIFTNDTIAAATARHEARLREMNAIFGQMYAEASRGTQAATTAMNTAATTAEEITRKLEAVRQGTQEAVGRGIEAVHTALEKLKSRLGEVEQAVGKASQTVNDATAKMAESYKGLTSLIEANLQRQIEAVKTRYQQEQAALDLSKQSEAAQITKSTQLLTDALAQQTTLRRQATTETLKLIESESQARLEAARRQGETEAERSANVTRVENEILATKRQTLATAIAEYRQHIDALNAEANRHLQEIQRIEEQKRLLAMTTDERIREIQRQGMTELQANEDRKRQIYEYQAKARELLAAGEFEQARQYAQKAMDLAAQVATTQTNEAKRAEEARKQAEQNMTQVVQLEAQSREAYRKQEWASAEQLMRQAEALRAEIAQKTEAADTAAKQSKNDVNQAIQSIRTSEELLKQSLEGEGAAHQQAAQAAQAAGETIRQTLNQTEGEVDQITAKLQTGLNLTIDVDKTRFEQALTELDAALAEKKYLLEIQADLQQAELKLREYEALLKEGKTLPVDADMTAAQAALDKLKTYADEHAQFELKVSTEKALAAIGNVQSMIMALQGLETQSNHFVSTNAEATRSEILSLNGMNTSSTHTIYVTKVETNASGGLVGQSPGVVGSVRRFSTGGAVTPSFPRMSGGTVPGTGLQDTVPRTLEAGAFVLRRAAVQKYGSLLQRFATGGNVVPGSLKTTGSAGTAANPADRVISRIEAAVAVAQAELEKLKSDLVAYEQERSSIHSLDDYYSYWRRYSEMQAAIPLKDAELRGLQLDLARARQRKVNNLATGGTAVGDSDTVPAMLTPGEYVIRKSAVARFGAGFFAALNNLALPAHALAQGIQGFATGGLVPPALASAASGAGIARPLLADNVGTSRSVRVELAAGDRQVNATVEGRDETRLLELLAAARSRAA